MPPAGDSHIGVFVIDNPCRLAGFGGHQRYHQRRNDGLSFFAAKRAAHSFANADDLVLRKPKDFCNHHLNLSGILSGGVDDQLTLFARISGCSL